MMMLGKTAGVNMNMKTVHTARVSAAVRPGASGRVARSLVVRAEQPGKASERPTPQPGPQPGTVFYAGNVYTEDQVSTLL